MPLTVADRVKELTTTTGTGALALSGAMTGFRRFSAACSVADTCYYAVQAVDGAGLPSGDWEVGLGTYSSANTLTRTTVLASSNANAAVTFAAGTKQVWLDLAAAQLLKAALPKLTILARTTDMAIATSSWTSVSYDTTAVQDDVGAFSSGTPTRVTVPAGYTRARITSYVGWANNSVGSRYQRIDKNGATIKLTALTAVNETGNTLTTRWLTVAAADYFEVVVNQNTGSSLNLSGVSFGGNSDVQFEWTP